MRKPVVTGQLMHPPLMGTRTSVRRASVLVLGLACGAVLAAGSASAAQKHARFKTGVYTAKTSQGSRFKFDVVAHTRTNNCGTHAGQYCFYVKTYPTFEWVCAGTPAEAGEFAVPDGFVKASGKFSYSQPLQGDSQPLIQFTAVLSGSHATGSFREEDLDNNAPGSTATCDSGKVTWKAKAG